MITLVIRYTINPNQGADLKEYVTAELEPIRRSGGKVLGYFLPTDFAGPTNEALGLIDFPNLAEYEIYRKRLAEDPGHKENAARLELSGVVLATNRALIQRFKEE